MGKNKQKNKKQSPQDKGNTSPNNGANMPTTADVNENKKKKDKNTLKYVLGGLAALILILGLAALWHFTPWSTQEEGSIYKFKKNYVLSAGYKSYNVCAGDSIEIFDGNKAVLSGDTVCIPFEILTDENEVTADSFVCINNVKGTKRVFTYISTNGSKRLLDISRPDSLLFEAVDGEMFEICEELDVENERPILVLGDHKLWPDYSIKELNDDELKGDNAAIVPERFVVFRDTVFVKFAMAESAHDVRIYKEIEDSLLASAGTDGNTVKFHVTEQVPGETCYRISAEGHVSCLIKPAIADMVEIPHQEAAGQSKWLLWMLAIIAIVEGIVIAVAAVFYFRKKQKSSGAAKDVSGAGGGEANEEDKASAQEMENIRTQITEKEKKIQDLEKELEELPEETDDQDLPAQEVHVDMPRPETPEKQLTWLKQLLDSEKYQGEDFVKQLKHEWERTSDSPSTFAKANFETAYEKWLQLSNARQQAESEQSASTQEENDKRAQLKKQIETEKANLVSLQEKLSRIGKEAGEALDDELNKMKAEVDDLQKALKKAKAEIEKAEKRAKQAEDDSKKTKERVTKSFEASIASLEKEKNECSERLKSQSKELDDTRADLDRTCEELKQTKEIVKAKAKALERYSKTITDISPAKDYADKLEKLLQTAADIEKAAIILGQNKHVDDYLINKYIARYRAALSTIDLQTLTTDVLNATKAQFVYKGQMLASFDQKDKKAFHEQMKLYFYDTYLKKFVDALVVLNETMVGMQYLADGATASDVKPFVDYRKEIKAILAALEIEVQTVSIMESCADNLSLTVIPKQLDFDCPRNSICQIDNCIVYLKGAIVPNEKIQVIVKC